MLKANQARGVIFSFNCIMFIGFSVIHFWKCFKVDPDYNLFAMLSIFLILLTVSGLFLLVPILVIIIFVYIFFIDLASG